MYVFRCKMCGGTIEFNSGDSTGVCEYCGTKQTLPHLDDDRRANLYDRANHFRRNNDFDKAAGIYEQILNEDTTDAEAYWSLVLCRYGIEYVEDPATHKRLPTINRTQFTSVYDDEDYKSALKYADIYQRSIYEEEATTINEIQKGILAISQKEEPFDIFICYKETDQNGRRTPDSVLANDLYYQLTNEGFKVFFSRITLEDKLGIAYEPYIFAALNSAKIMVVLGTKPEYFNAVWVKNEWSRFLSLVKQSGGKKVLIPAYRDMDPYDLPEEFSHLQAQDMSRLGFMQDLIRGINKIVSANDLKQTVKETIVIGTGNANTEPLLKRAFLFLEDGDWTEADTYCEKVLDLDPENAQAYLGKLMAELQVHRQEELVECKQPFDNNNNYRKVIRFGDDKLTEMLSGYLKVIIERNENARLFNAYNNAVSFMRLANSESDYKEAAAIFKTIYGFRDADTLYNQCLEAAEVCRKDDIYDFAISKMNGEKTEGYEKAIEIFNTIPGWKDADEQISECRKKIEEIKASKGAVHLEYNYHYDKRQFEKETNEIKEINGIKEKKTKKHNLLFACVLIVFFAMLFSIIWSITKPKRTYNTAVALYKAGNYEEAIERFKTIINYKDSYAQKEKCEIALNEDKYIDAVKLYNDGNYEEALKTFKLLNGYKDSAEKIKEIKPKYYKQVLPDASIGSIIFFGAYEQDNDTISGKEDIEWLVLSKQGNKMLVISKYALDCKPYNEKSKEVTWGNCSLRTWLNEEFLNTAFDTEEQKMILTTVVTADKNPESDILPGNDTNDKVFILSMEEAKILFDSDGSRMCQPTEYCVTQGVWRDEGNENSLWWLRTPGKESSYASCVHVDGSLYSEGFEVSDGLFAVRPALWIDIDE